jgi:wobble nucleotide-excising tRNase
MLLRINRVDDFRALQSWTPSSGLRDFSKYNVVFGTNGSGKSTLAALLYDAATPGSWPAGLQVGVRIDESERTISSQADVFWGRVRVFDRDYVERNFRFDGDTGSTAEQLLVLGEERIGAEEERKKAQARTAEIDKALPKPRKEKQDALKARDKLATDLARTISEELTGVAPRYSARSYTAAQVRTLLTRKLSVEPDLDIAQQLRAAREVTVPLLVVPAIVDYSFDSLVGHVRDILGGKALSVAIKELAEHPTWGHWVEQGVTLHADRDSCIFCGSQIDESRVRALEAHFDDSLRELQGRIESLKSQLDSVRRSCTSAVADLPKAAEIVDQHREEYEKAVKLVTDDLEKFSEGCSSLLAELDAKLSAVFTSCDLARVPTTTNISLVKIVEVLKKHNEYVDNIEQNRLKAAEQIEHARVASIAEEYAKQQLKADEAAEMERSLDEERTRLGAILLQNQESDLDPLPLAERLSEDIAQMLGRSDLRFEAKDGGYRLTRNGIPASRLSEGEQNAVALLYFMRSLEGHGTDQEDCVVVIDDPVSSLDHNSLIGASALLWARLVKKCGQLIMLTHNYELFRTWSYQLNSARLGKNAFSLYEMRPSVRLDAAGQAIRSPRLADWPVDFQMQKRLRSEYHYLFWTVVRTLNECRDDPSPEKEAEAAAILPNVCRRLLEAFLAFRDPAEVGSLQNQVQNAGPAVVDGEVRTRVLRFVHTYSHNEEASVSEPFGRPETLVNIAAVLQFMRSLDPDHFEKMCIALEVPFDVTSDVPASTTA